MLGSGGVKSIAGLGAMAVFERESLRPAAVADCSAGAIFGAAIATGLPMREATRLATSLWTSEITGRRRHRALLEIAPPRWAGFGEAFALRDDRAIRQRLHAAFGSAHIEQLPLPLRIQATDAGSGAVGRVTVALGFRVPLPRSVGSATRLATRVTAALSNNLLDARLAAADPSRLDLMLPEPDRRIGLFDSEAMPNLLDLGRRAAEAALPRLRSLLRTPVRWAVVA